MPNPHQPSHYRHDIDGLRAIAVLLVVFCHMELPFFSGGYIGVDVFFVISGFLITKIIYRELQEGSFTFRHFYIRRIKRLLPALVVLLAFCAVAFAATLSPHDLEKFTASMVWVSLFAGNFYFWIHHGGYFSENAKEAPLLHTWSLAIEEQFYFIWPIALLLLIRLLPLRVLPWLLLIALAVLTYASELALNYSMGASYYLLPTRFFELMIGAVLAVWWNKLPMPGKYFSLVVSIAALASIAFFAVTLDAQSRFPGFNAFYVCVATAALLYCGQQVHNPIARLLSLRPMVFIGLISYSLYLWHWPLLVWLNYRGIELSVIGLVVTFLTMLLAAWLSWRFVEQPFRKNTFSLKRLTLTWFAAPVATLLMVSYVTQHYQGFPARFDYQTVEIEKALNSFSNVIRGECHSSFRQRHQQPTTDCQLGDSDAKKTGFLFGDSHANHFTGFLDNVGKAAGIRITDYTMDQCPPIFGLSWGSSSYRAQGCKQRNQQAQKFIKYQNPDYVFLAASWPHYRSRFVFRDGVHLLSAEEIEQEVYEKKRETMLFITGFNAKPVIIKDIAYAGSHDPKCTLKNTMFSTERNCLLNHNHNTMMINIIERLASEFEDLYVIDAKQFYCDGIYCQAELEGIPLYRDNDHLNHVASKLLGTLYLSSGAWISPSP
ncbi:acyltransferase family protein [Alkalimonas sp. MEB108]|uniref:Acyltransferase family protein n=1 Tax=Alkalimonas cellulosilytica TaxID=3058395 RepID=A0ABU7J235_9GAMM|nr:acyltransferase family protein [Alkalimonas sp. MEB108]MEE2000422.1 acyltransferase family protein [Alkalimonas sp. MEB108]